MKLYFENSWELRVYCFMRVVQNNKVILCTNDFYIDKEFVKCFNEIKKA